jgi:hypothetical protein
LARDDLSETRDSISRSVGLVDLQVRPAAYFSGWEDFLLHRQEVLARYDGYFPKAGKA